MSLLAAAIVTRSEITIRRVPIEFLEIELATLGEMGFRYARSEEYVARNGHTRLVDITTYESDLHAPLDKIHPMPFPGLNIDNLPFFAVIAAVAEGQTLLHDWVYENRAIYLTELNKLGGQVKLLDPHRVMIEGPDALLRRRGRLPAGAAPGRRHPAGDARLEGHVGAALDLRHPPRLRGPRRAAQRARRPDRAVPGHLSNRTASPPRPGPAVPGRRRGHVGGDPRHRLRVLAGVAVPVGLRLDQAAEVGAAQEHAVAGRAAVDLAVPERARVHLGVADGTGQRIHVPTVARSWCLARDPRRVHTARVAREATE